MKHAFTIVALVALGGGCKQEPAGDPTIRVLLHEDHVENAYPRLSADNREVLYQSNRTGAWQLYILDLATGASRPLTSAGNNNLPDWSPDNSRIAFVSDRDGDEEIYVMQRDGSGQRRLTTRRGRDIHPYFSPDGKALLYNAQLPAGSFDVHTLDLASGQSRGLTNAREDETCARLSPDSRHIVMLRNDTSGDDLWLVDAAGGNPQNLTRAPQVRDGWPTFSPDGRWIYYASMTSGSFRIHRMRLDGTGIESLTDATLAEEDARPFVSHDGRHLVFNRHHDGAIDIVERTL